MGLRIALDKLDEVPEPQRVLYKEVEGGSGFRLDLDDFEEPTALKKTLDKERDQRKSAEKKLKELEKKIREQSSGGESGDGDDDGHEGDDGGDDKGKRRKPNLEALKSKWRADWETEHRPTAEELEKLRTENRKLKLTDRVRAAAQKSGVLEEDLDDALKITEGEFDLDDDGEVVVLDRDGDPSSVSLEKFWSDVFKKRKPKFYKGSGASGSGASGSKGAGGAGGAAEFEKLPPAERIRRARQVGIK